MLRRIGYAAAGVVWAAALYLLLTGLFPWAFIGLYALRLFEWFLIGRKTGEAAGVGRWRTALLTMLLGPLWWLPRRRAAGAIALPDADAPDAGIAAAPVLEADAAPGEAFPDVPIAPDAPTAPRNDPAAPDSPAAP